MRSLRELRAMGVLVLRSWYRIGPRVRGGHTPQPTRGASAILMRLMFAALIYNFGFTSSLRVASHAQPSWAASWVALGAGCFVLATTFALELPSVRMPAQALKSNLLELLPLSPLSLLVLSLSQALLTLPLNLALALSLHPPTGPGHWLAGAVALALTQFVVFGLLGACLGKLCKRALSAYGASRLSWLSSLPMLAGIVLMQGAPLRAQLPAPWWGDGLGGALLGQNVWQTVAVLVGLALALAATFFRLERNHELSEPVRPGTVSSGLVDRADMARLDLLLNRREPGGSFQVPFLMLLSAGFMGVLTWTFVPHSGARMLWNLAAAVTLQMVTPLGMQRATRGATRDMLARPLLGALPISPGATLANKANALRRTLLIVASPLCLVLLVSYREPGLAPQLAWRLLAGLLAVAIYASAATYVAFLTAGLGAVKPSGGVFGSLESFLLAVPFASSLFSPSAASAALSLLTLAALTYEARRAALKTIDWLDDPEREHETEVWKALVVFGGFQGAQLLTQQLASLFGDLLSPALQMLLAYTLASLALWAMTQREQETSAPSYGFRLLPLGVLAGVASSAVAWAYVHLSSPTPVAPPLQSGKLEWGLALGAIVIVAPLVEERFFRGWLQPALEKALGSRRSWAPLLTALAFAAAHPAFSFVPVLVLGLLNGFIMLRYRSLSACMLAHALHNVCALYLSGAL